MSRLVRMSLSGTRARSTLAWALLTAIGLFSQSGRASAQDFFDLNSPEVKKFKTLLRTGGLRERNTGNTVVSNAQSFRDGGGYDEKHSGHGVPEDVILSGAKLLSKANSQSGTYCSGFTFAVAAKTLKSNPEMASFSAEKLREFQHAWFGATEESREKQAVYALTAFGIGKEVTFDAAEPGDFIQFWREKSGHSAVFLGYERKDGKAIGIRYRSSQASTDGVGDKLEYFRSDEGTGTVDRLRTYFGRVE